MEQTLRKLLDYQERFRIALQAAGVCVFEVDIPGQRYTFFENAEAIYGKSGAQILKELEPFSQLPPEEYQRQVSRYFSHPEDEETIGRAFRSIYSGNHASYTARMRAGDTGYTWCKVDVIPVMEQGAPARMVGVVSNLDYMIRQSRQYQDQAERDPLTGLLNRYGMEQQLDELLRRSPQEPFLLLLADIDGLKQINDQGGHLAGDDAICTFAAALEKHLPQAELRARWGGDEFLLILRSAPGRERLVEQLEPLLEGLSLSGTGLRMTGSFGAARFPDHAGTVEELFRLADRALYRAKRSKPLFCLWGETPGAPEKGQ